MLYPETYDSTADPVRPAPRSGGSAAWSVDFPLRREPAPSAHRSPRCRRNAAREAGRARSRLEGRGAGWTARSQPEARRGGPGFGWAARRRARRARFRVFTLRGAPRRRSAVERLAQRLIDRLSG
jgi:hypothetical protein